MDDPDSDGQSCVSMSVGQGSLVSFSKHASDPTPSSRESSPRPTVPTLHSTRALDLRPRCSKASMAKLGVMFLCIGFLVLNFSTNISELNNESKMWNLFVDESKKNIKNVLQKGVARCYVNNVTKTLSVACYFNNVPTIKTFNLGANFDFNTCMLL